MQNMHHNHKMLKNRQKKAERSGFQGQRASECCQNAGAGERGVQIGAGMGKWEEIWRKREGEGEGKRKCSKTDKRRQKGQVLRGREHESGVRRQEQVKEGCKLVKEWGNGRKFGEEGGREGRERENAQKQTKEGRKVWFSGVVSMRVVSEGRSK
jgi:hypothetical protein